MEQMKVAGELYDIQEKERKKQRAKEIRKARGKAWQAKKRTPEQEALKKQRQRSRMQSECSARPEPRRSRRARPPEYKCKWLM